MKKSWKIIKIVIPLVCLAAAGYYFFANETDRHFNQEDYVVRKDNLIQKITFTGKVKPNRSTSITPAFKGYIRKIYVSVGDMVKKGAPLVTITQTPTGGVDSFPIRAPFDGIVVQINNSEGEYVENNRENYILRVDDTRKFFIDANVPEIDISKVSIGQEVIIRLSASPEKSYSGRIQKISLSDRSSDNWRDAGRVEFPIEIELLDPDETIRSGMSAVLDIVAAKRENVIVVPHEYLLNKEGKYFVKLKNGVEREVAVGLQNASYFEIQSGLDEGEELEAIDFLSIFDEEA